MYTKPQRAEYDVCIVGSWAGGGADEPYEKLQRALRADIDEAAWRSLYSTVSRPFERPETGRIAVKVINHYGDEVLKVVAC